MFNRCSESFTRFKKSVYNFITGRHSALTVRLLKNNNGSAMSIEFLILLPIILFLIFGGTDYLVTQVQYDQIEHLKVFYLDRMKIDGTLTDDDRTKLFNKLTVQGYSNIMITATDANGDALDSTTVLVRNIDNPDNSKLVLNIIATPKFKPFMFGQLLGATPTSDFYFNVGGETLSEKAKNG